MRLCGPPGCHSNLCLYFVQSPVSSGKHLVLHGPRKNNPMELNPETELAKPSSLSARYAITGDLVQPVGDGFCAARWRTILPEQNSPNRGPIYVAKSANSMLNPSY